MKSLRTRLETAEKTAAAEHDKSEFEIIPLSRKIEIIQELRNTWTVAELDRQIIENETDPVYIARLKMIKEIIIGERYE